MSQNGNGFSEYIVFVDESGDHGLVSIDPNYPIFVLAFCIMKKVDYWNILTPRLQEFKMVHFGHDGVVLHELAMRKGMGDFSFLNSQQRKDDFMEGLTRIIEKTPFFIGSIVFRKDVLKESGNPCNPYHLALEWCLVQTYGFLIECGTDHHITHILFEKRGKREDEELKQEFERIRERRDQEGNSTPFEMVFIDKKANHIGLQLADLVARPIGLSSLRPEQPNRTYDILKKKFLPPPTFEGADKNKD